ncbi:PPC domain-containing DNA-binding protein [Thermococcus stetteri]|uniref:PPC domain-containing DNA-binding protein n=1 Tax=Thermococcus stetteri TaxID=49900 RepID=UPI001AE277F1|nr:PPC domain-containing DNA-binding protein [Thermococcus stetteri]MBP1910786.1 putative DNA-binding protein with PD1-like motif [Thermococcus stetteri]
MEFKPGRMFLFRVPEGEDLLEAISRFVESKGIKAGVVMGIGSLRNPVVGYYSEDEKRYKSIELSGTFELLSLNGNISLKEGKPFAHLHVTLGDDKGRVFGGHLIRGEVFVSEVYIGELVGEPLERKDMGNNLWLWEAER